jgi:fermentation-respiration switch protein FrsA (DUF1100 family)
MWSVGNPEERKGLQVDALKGNYRAHLQHQQTARPVSFPRITSSSVGSAKGVPPQFMPYCMAAFDSVDSLDPVAGSRSKRRSRGIARSCTASGASLEKPRTLFKLASSDAHVVDLKQPIGRSESALATPVFLTHAKDDDFVPIHNGEKLLTAPLHGCHMKSV